MKDVNKVILVGRLGADPIQRETKNGKVVVHFSLATSRRIQSEGESSEAVTEETQWHKVLAWGKEGENCAQFLKKGASVYVEGSIRSHKFDGKDGTPRTVFEVYADSVSFLGSPRPKAAEPFDFASAV